MNHSVNHINEFDEFIKHLHSFQTFIKSSDFISFLLKAKEEELEQWNQLVSKVGDLVPKINHQRYALEDIMLFNQLANQILEKVLLEPYEKDTKDLIQKIAYGINKD